MFVFDYIGATALVHFFVPKTARDRGSAYSSKYCNQIIKVNLQCILYVKSFVQKCMIKNATQIDCAIFCFFFFLQLVKTDVSGKTAKEHDDLQAKCRELRVQCLDLEKKRQICK